VTDAMAFLSKVNAGQRVEVGANVAVIGSGYGAATAARVALRLGAKSAVIISPEPKLSIPEDELAETLAEGVEIKDSTSPAKIAAADGKLRLECGPAGVEKVRINGSGFAIDVDTVIAATGGAADLPDQFGLGLGDKESIQVNPEDLSTGRKGVFAGGDVVSGASFIEALAAGRTAAASIDRYLGGSGDIDETLAPIAEEIPRIGRISNFSQRKREEMPAAAVSERKSSFIQVEQGFTDEAGLEESMRCMGCDLRYMVGRMVAQPPS
jgi:formate dehydrogenase beta subunit